MALIGDSHVYYGVSPNARALCQVVGLLRSAGISARRAKDDRRGDYDRLICEVAGRREVTTILDDVTHKG